MPKTSRRREHASAIVLGSVMFVGGLIIPVAIGIAQASPLVRVELQERLIEGVKMHSAAIAEYVFANSTSSEARQTSSSASSEPISSVAASVPNVTVIEIPQSSSSSSVSSIDASHNAVGVFLTPLSVGREDFLIKTMEGVGEAGGNALVFDVKGSAVYFDGDLPMAKELGLHQVKYDLAEVLQMAKERGIYTIGRFIAVKDAGFTKARPDTMIAHPTTGGKIGYEFIDPENADALEYNRQALCALAKSGIHEINLDYIRFSTEQVGALGAYTMEEKSRKVTAFVQMARNAIDDCGPQTKLGVSTYAILGWNYEKNLATLGQDVANWGGLVDIISPMAYPATFAANAYYNPGKDPGSRMYFLVWRTLEGYKELLGENAYKLRPWIQGYGVTTKNMQDQMKAVTDAGLCGFSVWNANNAYGVTFKAIPSFKKGEGCGVM